jgi:hypothetical protein
MYKRNAEVLCGLDAEHDSRYPNETKRKKKRKKKPEHHVSSL